MENTILSAALFSRESFEELEKYNIINDLSDQGQVLWELFQQYYKVDTNATKVDQSILLKQLERRSPKMTERFKVYLDSLEPTSGTNLVHEVIAQRKEKISHDLIQELANKQEDRVFDLFKEYELLSSGELENDDTNEIIIAPDLTEMFATRTAEHRIPIYPSVLTQNLEGGALPGHHIVLFAPTDMGKTFFVLNMIRGFIEHKYKVLYVCNEDPVSDLIERFLIGLTGKGKYLVQRHLDKAQTFAEKLGWDNLVWAELSPGTLFDIDGLIEKHEPQILVVDQIRNIDVGEKDSVRAYEIAAKAMRNFAKRYGILSVSVTQAADSATGKAVLGRGDIDGSNVGIPGSADLMLGIGATEEQEFTGSRTLSFPKNKISGNKQPIMCFFNHDTMRVEE